MKNQKVLNTLHGMTGHMPTFSRQGDNGTSLYLGCCIGHKDTRPSMSIAMFPNGNISFTCFKGCMEKYELWNIYNKKTIIYTSDERKHNATIRADEKPYIRARTEDYVLYDYLDEENNLHYQKLKFRDKTYGFRVPHPRYGWFYSIKGVRRVIYNLPKVLRSNLVFVVEGEKDADTLEEMGLVGTCNPDGATKSVFKTKWLAEYNKWFTGKDVVIIPDNDDVGIKQAHHIAGQLESEAKTLTMLTIPNLLQTEDLTDWILLLGGNRKKLLNLVESQFNNILENKEHEANAV